MRFYIFPCEQQSYCYCSEQLVSVQRRDQTVSSGAGVVRAGAGVRTSVPGEVSRYRQSPAALWPVMRQPQ